MKDLRDPAFEHVSINSYARDASHVLQLGRNKGPAETRFHACGCCFCKEAVRVRQPNPVEDLGMEDGVKVP